MNKNGFVIGCKSTDFLANPIDFISQLAAATTWISPVSVEIVRSVSRVINFLRHDESMLLDVFSRRDKSTSLQTHALTINKMFHLIVQPCRDAIYRVSNHASIITQPQGCISSSGHLATLLSTYNAVSFMSFWSRMIRS